MGILIHHGGWWSQIHHGSALTGLCRLSASVPQSKLSKIVIFQNSTWWILVQHGDVFEFEFNHESGGEFEFTMGAFYRYAWSERRCSSKANFQHFLYFKFQRGDFNSPWGVMKSNSPWERFTGLCDLSAGVPQSKLSKIVIFQISTWWILVQRGTWSNSNSTTRGVVNSNSPWERLTGLCRLSACVPRKQTFNRLLYFEFQRGDFNSPWGVMNSISPWERFTGFCRLSAGLPQSRLSKIVIFQISTWWILVQHGTCSNSNSTTRGVVNSNSPWERLTGLCRLSAGVPRNADFQQIVIFRISTWWF